MRHLSQSSLTLTIVLFLLISSCRDCPPCPKDMEVPQCFKDMIPYEVGDTTLFRNVMGDTMQFICEKKEYRQYPNALQDLADEGCCPSYMVEALSSKLTNAEGFISLETTSFDPISMSIDFRLNLMDIRKEAYIQNCLKYTIDSLKITHLTFHNLSAFKLSQSEDTVFVNQSEKMGIVGFKLDGVEWAKIK